eukprot:820733_1
MAYSFDINGDVWQHMNGSLEQHVFDMFSDVKQSANCPDVIKAYCTWLFDECEVQSIREAWKRCYSQFNVTVLCHCGRCNNTKTYTKSIEISPLESCEFCIHNLSSFSPHTYVHIRMYFQHQNRK